MEQIDYSLFNADNLGIEQPEEEMIRLGWGDDDTEFQSEMIKLIEDAREHWYNLSEFREDRTVVRNFEVGKHWEDKITDPDNPNSTITEGELLSRNGRAPLVNNQIIAIKKNILGQYRDNDYKPQVIARKREDQKLTEMMTNALQYALSVNRAGELDTRTFEEGMRSGAVCQRIGYKWNKGRNIDEIDIDPVNPARMFWNTDMENPQLKDLRMIGTVSDVPIELLYQQFAQNDEDKEKIKSYFHNFNKRADYSNIWGPDNIDNIDFYVPHEYNRCRVIELWNLEIHRKVFYRDPLEGQLYKQSDEESIEEALEYIDMTNQARLQNALAQGIPEEAVPLLDSIEIRDEEVWMYYFLTPEGKVLDWGESPYWHEEHPFVLSLYPMSDSIVKGLLYDYLDQQRAINRYFTMLDFLNGVGSKGLLLFPEELMPDGWDEQDLQDQWTKMGGVILMKGDAKTNRMPQQVTANVSSASGVQMLELSLRMLKEISGVNEAIQGQKPSSGTPSSLYAQMANNATLALRDFFEWYSEFKRRRDEKVLKVQQQFYDTERNINISGKDYENEANLWNPDLGRYMEFDMVVGKSGNSSVYRQMIDDYLFKLWEAQAIDTSIFLENSSVPFADKILEQIREKEEQKAMMLQEMGQDQVNIDPQAEKLFNQALTNNGTTNINRSNL